MTYLLSLCYILHSGMSYTTRATLMTCCISGVPLHTPKVLANHNPATLIHLAIPPQCTHSVQLLGTGMWPTARALLYVWLWRQCLALRT